MKVLHVIDTLNVGGAERVFVDLVNILTRAGVHTEVLLLCEGGILESSLDTLVPINKLRRVNKYSPGKALKTHKLCKKFDIIHVHMRHCYSYIHAVQMSFGGKYKIVLHDHYGDIGINKKVPLALKLPSSPKFYIGVSKELCKWANECVKPAKQFLLSNIIVPQHGVEYKHVEGNKAIMVANIRPTKNLEFAIDLSNKLGFQLDIYGNVSNTEYYNYLIAKISGNPSVRIIEGVADFSDLYSQYNYALHTAKSETGPLVLMEYMAYGIPFISYKTGEVADMVSADLSDLFMETFEIEKWTECINRVKQNREVSQRLQAIFRDNFSPENYLQQCLQIYRDIVAC